MADSARRSAVPTRPSAGPRWRKWLRRGGRTALAATTLAFAAGSHGQPDAPLPLLLLPPVALGADDIAVVVNDADPASVEVGRAYAAARRIAAERVIHVSFPADRPALTEAQFRAVQAQLEATVPSTVQAYALAWTQPYRVECMSITSAFAFGFHIDHCAAGCQLTRPSPYFDANTTKPFRDLGLRPAMLLAAPGVAEAKAMIARGVRSDGRWPDGKAYLLSTSDGQRNVRATSFDHVQRLLARAYPIERLTSDSLAERSDVMFYFTGLTRVPDLASNRFLDGAIADHVTSSGGVLIDSPQMSVLDWIQAGATGSYGTAQEPCNFRQKFPDIAVVMGRYLAGETLIEAYWKSVQMPGQGVFVGEPLARPFGGVRSRASGDAVEFQTRSLRPGRYLLQAAEATFGPFRTIGATTVVDLGVHTIRLPRLPWRTYRLVPVAASAAAVPSTVPVR